MSLKNFLSFLTYSMKLLPILSFNGSTTNAAPATFIIYADRVETENANNPLGEGPIDPDNFVPFPKNPLIAKFFIQLGGWKNWVPVY